MEEKKIHELRGIRKPKMAQEERDQERETMNKHLMLLHS